jgi:hypothetical protein
MELNERSWYLVKDTPKVSGFVGGRHPAPVPETEINQIAQQVAEGTAKPKPRVVFDANDHVRVTDGAFANFTGTIQEVNSGQAEGHRPRVDLRPRDASRARVRAGREDRPVAISCLGPRPRILVRIRASGPLLAGLAGAPPGFVS